MAENLRLRNAMHGGYRRASQAQDEEGQDLLASKLYKNSTPQSWTSRVLRNRSIAEACVAVLLLLSVFSLLLRTEDPRDTVKDFLRPFNHPPKSPAQQPLREDGLHLIIPTSHPDINLCKLLLGASLLGYPTPILAAWNEEYNREGILGGGSHVAKVSKVLEYLQLLPADQDDDLVMMLDAYDIWLQLPPSVLISRYFELLSTAQSNLETTLGVNAVRKEGLENLILFGAGKRCAPNQSHTVACYAIPDSPLPTDLYGNNTDTIIGHTYWYSTRQRYLNSGSIIGRVGPMRRMFAEAWKLIEVHPDKDPLDDGSGGSDFMYHGSDQSIFAGMYGRQEWAREKLRLKHAGRGAKVRSSSILGTPIDNVLEPSVAHEHIDLDLSAGNPWEFGMFLDYWSDVSHQTVNSETDGTWLHYNKQPVAAQIGERTHFDCAPHIPDGVPVDVLNATIPGQRDEGWESRSLYTHLCLGRVPVMVHHNGDKGRRESDWPRMWYLGNGSEMMEQLWKTLPGEPGSFEDATRRPRLRSAGGAWSDKGDYMAWSEVCPGEWHGEIFTH